MAKKKNNGDMSVVITKACFDSFVLVTLDNIKEWFNNESLFIIALSAKNKLSLLNSFTVRDRMVRGRYIYNHYWDSNVIKIAMMIKIDEPLDEYKDNISDIKALIKQEIKNKRLYARKIE